MSSGDCSVLYLLTFTLESWGVGWGRESLQHKTACDIYASNSHQPHYILPKGFSRASFG